MPPDPGWHESPTCEILELGLALAGGGTWPPCNSYLTTEYCWVLVGERVSVFG